VRRWLALTLVWIATIAPGPAKIRLPEGAERAVSSMSARQLHAMVETLASDAFAGRGVGHEGNRDAERFIARTFEESGVPPGGADGTYFQSVELYRPALSGDSRLTIEDARGTRVATYPAGTDFYPLPETGERVTRAPLLLAGHGISAPDVHHDDYAQLDARGAIVVVQDGAPEKLQTSTHVSDEQRLELSSLERKMKDAEAHGAAGVLIVRSYMPELRSVWPDHPSVRSSSYRLASDLRLHPAPLGAISDKAAAPIARALEARESLVAVFVPGLTAERVTVHNVLGFIEGRDPERRGEMIVIGAHLDHDGIDADGQIYNGADDNASGTAAVLSAAASLARAAAAGDRPARAVLFALWNGEEKGSLGAERFVDQPEPHRTVIANVNLDMVGRDEDIPDPSDWRFNGLPKTTAAANRNTLHLLGYSYSSDLAGAVLDANEAEGLTIREDYDNGAQSLLQRSDQWPFLAHGIPAVFLTSGLHPDYHTPQDDTDRIDFVKLERVARLAARAAWIVAEGPAPQIRRSR
jgi:peptidase M28-like protein